MLVAGVDEAGRGPCLGPLVLAVTLLEKEREEFLLEKGVKDSKQLSKEKREELFSYIKNNCVDLAVDLVSPEELDNLMLRKSLNEIEAMRIAKLLNGLSRKPDVVYVDSPDVLSENFAKRISKYLCFKTKIVSEHKADVNYVCVSAASIIAKVIRDREIENLNNIYGNIGSGYSSDEVTIKFIRNFLKDNKKLPSFVRKNWLTSENLLNEKYQKKITEVFV